VAHPRAVATIREDASPRTERMATGCVLQRWPCAKKGNLTNAEIAGRLFPSESTVKQHLRATYKALGVRNRTEAAAVLRGRGLRGVTPWGRLRPSPSRYEARSEQIPAGVAGPVLAYPLAGVRGCLASRGQNDAVPSDEAGGCVSRTG
jgi:hypothetical protein